MNDEESMRERLSALADGELSGHECSEVLAYARTEHGQASWQAYHVIGDVLRGVAVSPTLDAAMLGRLRAQIAQEPVLARGGDVPAAIAPARGEAANASLWHWKLAAGFASLTAAVALGWTAYANLGFEAGGGAPVTIADSAQNGGVAPAANRLIVDEQNVIRDPQLDKLMRQSGSYSGMSVIMREPFLHNAWFEAAPK